MSRISKKIFITDDDEVASPAPRALSPKLFPLPSGETISEDLEVLNNGGVSPMSSRISPEKAGSERTQSAISEDLEALNNGGVSYIVKKYTNKSIISIYHYNDKKSTKSGLITTKWFKNFYSENQAYLAQLGKEKYEYIFIGGKDIYEFSLLPEDKFVSFKCYIGNSSVTYSYIVGEKYTYFLTEKCAMDNSLIKNKKDPYESLYNYDGNDTPEIYFEVCDKSNYFMGKPTKKKDMYEEIAIKEENLNDDLDKLIKKAEKHFNDIEKRYIEGSIEFKMTFLTKSNAKKTVKEEMDKRKSWAKFRVEHFKTSVRGVEEKNRVSYLKRCVEDYLNVWLYKTEAAAKHYCLFLENWYSTL